ncbi:hypothetical protein Tco_0269553 [Tanacetum coccineum]
MMADLAKNTRTEASFVITRPALMVDSFKIIAHHLDTFLGICEPFKIKDIDRDAIKLRVFTFTLTDTDKEWLKSNVPGETLYEAWERLKKYLRQCPQHGLGCESCGGPHLTKHCDDKPMSSSEDACWLNQRQVNFQAGGSNGNTLSHKQGPLRFY